MRIPIKIKVRRGKDLITEDGVLWEGEVPPQYHRGRNRKMKSSRYKQAKALVGERAGEPTRGGCWGIEEEN